MLATFEPAGLIEECQTASVPHEDMLIIQVCILDLLVKKHHWSACSGRYLLKAAKTLRELPISVHLRGISGA